MERWTRVVLRFRWPILTGWLVVLLAGGFAFTHLSSLLSNEFSVPEPTRSGRGRFSSATSAIASDGAFTVVFRLREGVDRAAYVRLQRDVDRAARVVPDSTPRQLVPAGRQHRLYGDIVSTLSIRQGQGLHRRPLPGAPSRRRRPVLRDRTGRYPARTSTRSSPRICAKGR